MRQTAFIALLLLLPAFAEAQYEKRDSLIHLLPSASNDTTKALLLLTIADAYESNNQDSAIYYLEKSRALSESLKYLNGMFRYYRQSAIVSFTKGDYTTAMQQSQQGLGHARLLKDSSLVITMLNNISIVYGYLGNFEAQLNYMLQVKQAMEELKDSIHLSGVYHNISNAYQNLKQYRKSAGYALLSLKLHTTFKKPNGYINRVYATLAQDYEYLKLTDSALYFYEIAIKESLRSGDKYAEATIYGYLANLYSSRNQFAEMLKASTTSLRLAKKLQSRQMIASALYNVANANLFNHQTAAARTAINEALQIATNDSLRDELKNSYIVLSYIAAVEGDFKTSLWAQQKRDSIEQITVNEQVINSTTDLEKKYETEKKQGQITQLQSQTLVQQLSIRQKDTLNYILAGGAGALLTISLLGFRNFKHKQRLQQEKINTLEAEKRLAATEAVLKGEEQERARLAKDLHDGLGGMLSGIKYSFNTMKGNLIMTPDNAQAFERSMDMLDSSIKEMRRVAHNMMPEALVKFGLDTALKDFCNDITQSGALQIIYQSIGMDKATIEPTTAITIYRIVQELVANTMKHAAAKTAIVQLTKTDGVLSLTVEDDGKGFDISVLKQADGIGWLNIQNRVEFLNGSVDVQSKKEKGTSVHIEFNV